MNFSYSTPTVHNPTAVGTGLLDQQRAPVGQGLFTQQAQQLANYQPWHPYATPTPPPAVPAAPTSNSGTNWGEMAGLLGLLGLGSAGNNGYLGPLVKGTIDKITGLFGGTPLSNAVSDSGLEGDVAKSAASNADAIYGDAVGAAGSGTAGASLLGGGAAAAPTTEGIAGWGTGTAGATGAGDAAGSGLLGGQVASGAETAGITPAYEAASTIGTDASGAGAAGAGGSLGLGLAGAAVPLAIAAYGASTQPYTLTGQYYKRLTDSLTKGQSGNATYDKATPAAMQEYAAKNQLYQMLQQGPTHSDFGAQGAGLPANVLALASQYGMLNPDGTVKSGWSAPQPVAPRYSAYGKLLPASTNTVYDPSLLGASGSQAGPGGGAY